MRDVFQFVNILLFFNERIKCPYKTETSGNEQQATKKSNKKVLEDDKSQNSSNENDSSDGKKKKSELIDDYGNLNPTFINDKLNNANRIRLWTKENESYNVEKIYLSYLRNVRTFPQLSICLTIFEIAVNELNKRKEYYRKKEKSEIITETKEEEEDKKEEVKTKTTNENNHNGEKRRAMLKKKKLIDYNVECMFCEEFGDFLFCNECPNVAHLSCAKLKTIPDVWICPNCQNRKK